MQEKQSMVVDRLSVSIEELHHKFGAWPVIWALMRAIRRQRRVRNSVSHLSDRMLLDMGLPKRREALMKGHDILWRIRH
jgi:uncharacterized protein YjiS (DUF1127 family)